MNRYIHELLQGASARDVVEAQEDRKCAQCDGPIPEGKRKHANYCSAVCRWAKNTQRASSNPTRRKIKRENRHRWGASEKGRETQKAWASANKELIQKLNKARSRSVQGRICLSCGLTDADYKESGKVFGNSKLCNGCKKRLRYGLCVNKVHVMPPNSNGNGRPPREYPACLCAPGNIKPDYSDPNNRFPPRIPFEDKDIPEFRYRSTAYRRAHTTEFSASAEGIEKGKEAVSQEKKKQGGKWVPGISGGSRKGSSSKNPRRSTQGPTPRRARKPKDV